MKSSRANRRFRLHRLSRASALARAVACVLALALALGGYVAVAAPLHGAVTMAMQADDAGCDHHAIPTAEPAVAKHAVAEHGHASGDCCRIACACAFGHAVGQLAAPTLAGGEVVAAALPLSREPDVRVARSEPPLRPPTA